MCGAIIFCFEIICGNIQTRRKITENWKESCRWNTKIIVQHTQKRKQLSSRAFWKRQLLLCNAPSNNSMDVRAKQRLCYQRVFWTQAGLVAVSPHVISIIRQSSLVWQERWIINLNQIAVRLNYLALNPIFVLSQVRGAPALVSGAIIRLMNLWLSVQNAGNLYLSLRLSSCLVWY